MFTEGVLYGLLACLEQGRRQLHLLWKNISWHVVFQPMDWMETILGKNSAIFHRSGLKD